MTVPDDDRQRPGWPQLVAAAALLLLYVLMLAVMTALRHDADWDRLVYLLTGFEAIAFAGTGALFGVTAQRVSVTAVRKDAQAARAEADEARREASEDRRDANTGRMLALSIIAKAELGGVERGARRGARPSAGENEPIADDLAELVELVRLAYPTLRS